ncbi:MAG: hypothetical protein HWN65_10130 [Candidatus Helarchaeota archaeon]|nr:hypothetical protein [Candidatus Helarchaeota archaeon]
MNYQIPDVSITTCLDVLEAILNSEAPLSLDRISKYINKSTSYTRRALIFLNQLGFIFEKKTEWKTSDIAKKVKLANLEQKKLIVGNVLLKYKPFLMFCNFVLNDNITKEAARKVKTLFDVDSREEVVQRVLLNSGIFSGIIKKDKNKIQISLKSEKIPDSFTEELEKAIQDEFFTRIFLSQKLGDDLFNFLVEDEIENIIYGFLNYQTNPKQAISTSGQAFEDFLRRIGEEKFGCGSCSGIGQLISFLRNKKLIDKSHVDLGNAINRMRLLSSHSKEKETLELWNIHPDSAIESILLMLSLMRSIFNFIRNNTRII